MNSDELTEDQKKYAAFLSMMGASDEEIDKALKRESSNDSH